MIDNYQVGNWLGVGATCTTKEGILPDGTKIALKLVKMDNP